MKCVLNGGLNLLIINAAWHATARQIGEACQAHCFNLLHRVPMVRAHNPTSAATVWLISPWLVWLPKPLHYAYDSDAPKTQVHPIEGGSLRRGGREESCPHSTSCSFYVNNLHDGTLVCHRGCRRTQRTRSCLFTTQIACRSNTSRCGAWWPHRHVFGRERPARGDRRCCLRSRCRSGICSAGRGWGGIRGASN